MATTPRPLLWEFAVKRAENVQNTGGFTHCSGTEGKSLYLDDGIKAVPLHIEEGHWKEAVADDPVNITSDNASILNFKAATSSATFAVMATDEGLYLLK